MKKIDRFLDTKLEKIIEESRHIENPILKIEKLEEGLKLLQKFKDKTDITSHKIDIYYAIGQVIEENAL